MRESFDNTLLESIVFASFNSSAMVLDGVVYMMSYDDSYFASFHMGG